MRPALCIVFLSIAARILGAETYIVSGTVVHSLTRAPIAKAKVVLKKQRDSEAGLALVTGSDGRFQFSSVPDGKYTLTVERNGFVVQAYNQRHLYQQYSSAIVTGADQNTTDLVFALVPGAVISGRVLDVNGEPVPWARGEVYRVTGSGESRRARAMNTTTTDDQGYFRISSLAAGRYILAMKGKPWYADASRAGTVDTVGYPMTFYPAAVDPVSAEFIDLTAGQEFQARITMAPAPSYNITVKRPANLNGATPFVSFGGPSVYGATAYSQSSENLHAERTLLRVVGGRYHLVVWHGPQKRLAVRDVDINQNGQEIEFDDPPLASVRGVVEVPGNRAKLGAQPGVRLSGLLSDAVGLRAIEPDGSFHMEGLPPGPYEAVVRSNEPFVLRSITAKGAPVRDGQLILPATGTIDLSLVVETEVAEIEGRVIGDDRGTAGVMVVATAKDRIRDTWLHRVDQTDSDGSFSWRGLLPGEYLAFVFPEGDEALASDPAYLERLVDTAIPFAVHGTGKQKLSLTLPKPKE